MSDDQPVADTYEIRFGGQVRQGGRAFAALFVVPAVGCLVYAIPAVLADQFLWGAAGIACGVSLAACAAVGVREQTVMEPLGLRYRRWIWVDGLIAWADITSVTVERGKDKKEGFRIVVAAADRRDLKVPSLWFGGAHTAAEAADAAAQITAYQGRFTPLPPPG